MVSQVYTCIKHIIPHIKNMQFITCGYSTSIKLFFKKQHNNQGFALCASIQPLPVSIQPPNTPTSLSAIVPTGSKSPTGRPACTVARTTWNLLFLWIPLQAETLWITLPMGRNNIPKYGAPCLQILQAYQCQAHFLVVGLQCTDLLSTLEERTWQKHHKITVPEHLWHCPPTCNMPVTYQGISDICHFLLTKSYPHHVIKVMDQQCPVEWWDQARSYWLVGQSGTVSLGTHANFRVKLSQRSRFFPFPSGHLSRLIVPVSSGIARKKTQSRCLRCYCRVLAQGHQASLEFKELSVCGWSNFRNWVQGFDYYQGNSEFHRAYYTE